MPLIPKVLGDLPITHRRAPDNTVVINCDALRKTGPAMGARIGNEVLHDAVVYAAYPNTTVPARVVAVLTLSLA